jgi:very-short-patch-repair endonuclease
VDTAGLLIAVRPKDGFVEKKLARMATAAHGLLTHAQLLGADVTPAQIRSRLRKGLLTVEHRGVYRYGHRAPSDECRYLAAVLACGDGALLSGLAAAYLLGLVKGPAPTPEVTTRTNRRVKGVKTHRSRVIVPSDAVRCRGVPVTSPARTLVDIAGVLGESALARACHEAGVRYGTAPADVEARLSKAPKAKGAAKLRRVLRGDTPVTLSNLEARFLARLRAADLPLPETNRDAGGRWVDCRWPDQRLTVELDGYRYHSSRYAWEQDRRREREAYARGDDLRRYTYGDVFERPALMLAELRKLLRPGTNPT